jgi:hypothetical protein
MVGVDGDPVIGDGIAPTMTAARTMAPRLPLDRAVWAVIAAGMLLRLMPVLQVGFPYGDGGLYYAYIRDLTASHFIPPLTASYNGGISFPYPFLAFELVGLVSSVTRLDALTLMRFLPPVMSGLSVLAFAWLARELLGGKGPVLLATFLYATLPEVYRNNILGGGITKALMALLVLLALTAGVRAFQSGARRDYVYCGVLIGLAQLAHPDGGPASAIGLLFILLYVGPSARRIVAFVGSGLVALAVAAPWWLRVVVALGPTPLVAAAGNDHDPLVGVFGQVGELIFSSGLPLFAVALWIATTEAIVRRRHALLVLTAWSLGVAVLDQRNAYMDFPVAAALLSAAGVESLGGRAWPTVMRVHPDLAARARRWLMPVAAVVAGVAVALPLLVPGFTGPRDPLRAPDMVAMREVNAVVPTGTRFLVVTGATWYADDVGEWFPALTRAVSVATPQGTEWQGPGIFERTVAEHDSVQRCASRSMSCISAWSAATGVAFDAIFVAGPRAESSRQPEPTIPELLGIVPTIRSDCCAPLRGSLREDPGWRVVYAGPGAVIAVRAGTASSYPPRWRGRHAARRPS